MNKLLAPFILAFALAPCVPARAQSNYPDKPITLIVPFSAGGTSDATARKWGDVLARKLGQPVIVENVAGAGGALGARKVAKAKADGYTLLMGSLNDVVLTPLALKGTQYQSSDLQIAMLTGVTPGVVVTGNQSGNPSAFQSMADVLAAAKKRPLSFGTPGKGTFHHIVLELIAERSKVEFLHVPYKGGAQFLTDTIGGQINLSVSSVALAEPLIRNKQLRPLAVTTATRVDVLKDVPTLAECAPQFKDLDLSVWLGIFAPSGTPRPVMEKLNAVLREAYQTEQIQAFLKQGGSYVPAAGLDLFGAQRFADGEARKYRAVAARLNLQD